MDTLNRNMVVEPMQQAFHPITPQTKEEALNLCVRNTPPSPVYTYDYNYNRSSPKSFDTIPRFNSMGSPSSTSETSEASDRLQIQPSPPDPLRGCPYPPASPQKTKTTRPFKAFPKTPLPLAFPITSSDPIVNQESTEAYMRFRNQMLSQLHPPNTGTNKNMRRMSQSSQNSHSGDPTYWEKRKKNNEAAKRSRDARRAKEDEIAIRCAFLEQENLRLKFKLATVEEQLRHALYR